ncbi:ubiquitin-like protein 4A [Monodelphis domestica]|uniref:Ubiquitin-like protein 4A n=1 Tax=Monodelphis domestica TaxID=13616 RepID=F7BQ80_MONDO|nr:ubiquitin-like protein 4A [Monodelphis domestica]
MQLTVKALQGRECSLQVPDDERVATLKLLVSEKLNVPVVQQRLLFKGKALADELRLSDYSIGPNSKINLVIKLPDEATARLGPSKSQAPPQSLPTWLLVSQILARHFNTADTRRVLEQLQKDYDRSLRLLSLDDIERLATRMLNCTVSEPVEAGFLD